MLRRVFVARVNVGATSDVGQVYRPGPRRPSVSHAPRPRRAVVPRDRAEVPLKDANAPNRLFKEQGWHRHQRRSQSLPKLRTPPIAFQRPVPPGRVWTLYRVKTQVADAR